MNPESQIIEKIDALQRHIIALESMVAEAVGRRPSDRSIVTWSEAARILGIEAGDPAKAARTRLHRAAAKPDGVMLRLGKHGVERRGFDAWLAQQTAPGEAGQLAIARRGGRRGGGAR